MELVKADQIIMDFCVKFEQVFGKEFVAPNMHMHGCLRECILGPFILFGVFPLKGTTEFLNT